MISRFNTCYSWVARALYHKHTAYPLGRCTWGVDASGGEITVICTREATVYYNALGGERLFQLCDQHAAILQTKRSPWVRVTSNISVWAKNIAAHGGYRRWSQRSFYNT